MERREDNISSFTLDESTIPVLEEIANGIPGGFFIYHADGDEELIYANRTLFRFFGCSTEEQFRELTGYTFRGMVHPDDIDDVEHSISRQIAEDNYHMDYVEYRIIQRDGSIRWVEDYGHFMHTKAYGDIFYVFIDDATDRLEKRLSDLEEVNGELSLAYTQEAQFKRAVLRDCVSVAEIDITRDRFIFSSDFPTLRSPNEDLIRPLNYSGYIANRAKQVSESDRAQYHEFFSAERLKGCFERGELEQIFENCLSDGSGSNQMFRHSLFLYRNARSGDVMATCITKDITASAEHKRLLEAAWRQADIANAARNAFLNSISHDIRTPLNGIMGYVELMERHVNEPDTMLKYIQNIRLFSEQLYDMWKNSLAITSSKSKSVVLKEEKLCLRDVLEELERRTAEYAKAKKITFSLQADGLRHLYVMADYVQLREILWQILDNAVKYTPEGGRVVFSAEEQGCTDGFAHYQFEIADNGIGMDSSFMSKLFMPFERACSTTQSGVHGAGLGLPVAKNLVELMNGSISVDSAPGKGSRFCVALTLRLQPEQEQPVVNESGRVSLAGKRILLVEDNEINREIAAELLKAVGFLVDFAADGAAAVDMVRRFPPYDAVLMDLQMPVMDGYDSALAIRALSDPRRAQTPIIALSADSFTESQERCLACGMNAHCSKPLDIDKLCAIIRAVLPA